MYFLDDDVLVEHDQRHERRAFLMQLLFAHTFEDQDQQYLDPEITSNEDAKLLDEVKVMIPSIDQEIALYAPERPLSEINTVDLAIMRLIVFESRSQKTPKKVLVDEAVELAKEFGSETSAKFVNGVLGKILFQEINCTEQKLVQKVEQKKDAHEQN
jgi:N utilization substance protein B